MKTRIITGLIFTFVVLLFVIPAHFNRNAVLGLGFIMSLGTARELNINLQSKFAIWPGFLLVPWVLLPFLVPILIIGFGLDFSNEWLKFNLHNWNFNQTDYSWFLLIGATIGILTLLLVVYALISTVLLACKRGPQVLVPSLFSHLAGLYVFLPTVSLLVLMYFVKGGYFWFLLALFSPWFSDVGAYFTGVLFGKRQLIPLISPKKTVAGFLGGIGATIVLAMLAFWGMASHLPTEEVAKPSELLIIGAVSGLVLGLVAQFGDWLASLIKRHLDIKDFSNLLPGHGGILDRFDSVFFTLPTTVILVLVISLFY